MYAYAQSKVEICGVNTAKLQTLKNDEMRELLDRSHHGDKDARDKLICGNLRLVLSVIQRFTSRGENPDDLFQVGCIGLIKAIDNFDPSHEVMFSTYGVPMISGEVKRFLRDNNAVRVSRSMRDTAYRAMQIKEQLTNENGKEPNITEIAKRMELPPEDIVIALESIVEPVSLYEPVFSDGGDTIYIMDQVKGGTTDGGDKLYITGSLQALYGEEGDWLEEIAMREAIRDLTDRERKILSMRFIDGKTQTEVAGEIGISQAQVSRLEKGAMSRIKAEL